MVEFTREALTEYFAANPREWAKVAPIHPGTVELISAIADKNAFSDARFLDFHSRKDAREQVCEADCMKDVLRLFRSDAEFERRERVIQAARAEIDARGYFSGGAQGPEALSANAPASEDGSQGT